MRRRNGSAEYAHGQAGSVNSWMTTSAPWTSRQVVVSGTAQLRVRRL